MRTTPLIRRWTITTRCILPVLLKNIIEPYPSNWSAPPTISKYCGEVTGEYLEGSPKDRGAAPPGVWAFLFQHADVRLNDRTVGSRTISVYFDSQKTLHIDYLIDGKAASKKTFPPSQYMCLKSGLQLLIHKRTGKGIFNKVPNWGEITIKAELFRMDDYLYVKSTWYTWALIFYFVPYATNSESWMRLASRSA